MLPDKPALDDDDDELVLELPDAGDEDERDFEPDDDSDLEVEDELDGGLDADTGTVEGAEGDVALDDDDDEASWLDDGRGPNEDPDDDDGGEKEEEGLIEGSEPAQESGRDDWESDELEPEENGEATGDAGEEGFGDEALVAELELEGLPPLDDGAGEGLEADAEVEAFAAELGEIENDELRVSSGVGEHEGGIVVIEGLRCARLAPERVIVETLLRGGRPLATLLAAGDAGIGWDGTLLVADAVAARAERRFAGAEAALGLAAAERAGGPAIALATPSGLLCSRDGGRQFETAAPLPVASASTPSSLALLAAPAGGALRLFAAAPAGGLFVSDDFGASFQAVQLPFSLQVLRLSISASQTLLVFGRDGAGTARALRSDERGERFEPLELAVNEIERLQDLQQCGELSLCVRRSPQPQLVWRSPGREWTPLAPPAAAPALLLDEHDRSSAYFCVRAKDRLWLLRIGLGEPERLAEIVCELETTAGAPLQLAGAHGSGITTLQLGTERAWYRIALRLDGGSRD